MKRTAKIVAVALAVLMALTVVPFAAFASAKTDDAADRVAGWKANYQLFIDTILDNSNFTSWNYVDQNKKALTQQMDISTAFALYDSAWRNYATKEISIDNAEKILLGLIEKAEYTFDDGYVDEIVKVLEGAQDVNDFIQKANKYLDIDLFKSQGWSTTFQVIGTVVDVANAYQNYRDQFIAAYANVLSVQMANAYYVDMLQYIVDNTDNSVLRQAAQKLINDIQKSVEDVIGEIVAKAAADGAEKGVDTLINIAMNSNAYTAVALKVYNGAKSVADFLWNTGDQYALIDTVVTAYDFQELIAAWTADALAEDSEKALIAVDMLLTARNICENALYNLKLAENDGVIGKVKSQLYGTVYEDIEISLASIDAIRAAMFDQDVASFRKVERAIYAYCPVDVQILKADNSGVYTLKDGRVVNDVTDSGIYVSVYSEYAKDYLKIAYLYDAYKVRLSGTGEGTVTLIMDVLNADGSVSDWSFTDRAVSAGTKIVFDTDFEGTPYYLASDTDAKTYFNDDFVASKHPEVTAKDVADAVITVGKKEAKSFADIIKEFFQKLFASIANIFKKK